MGWLAVGTINAIDPFAIANRYFANAGMIVITFEPSRHKGIRRPVRDQRAWRILRCAEDRAERPTATSQKS
jgi:hypothetical protein